MSHRFLKILVVLMLSGGLAQGFAAEADKKTAAEFPGRNLYPAVPFIELDDLYKKRKDVVIVDVRSAYEYDTLRIKDAVNIPLSDSGDEFARQINDLRKSNPGKPIVMYCNGKTCMKSYKAVSTCRSHNIENVISYDRGVFDWAKKYPDEAALLGKSPIDPKNIISKDQFKKHLLPPEEFEHQATSGKAVVLDMRDRFQREALAIFVGFESSVFFDDTATLDKHLAKVKRENRPLLIYDAAGKQVEWLQYYLEEKDIADYKFMEGGADAYFKNLRKQFVR